MSSPMTLREAVEIVECGRFDYSHPRGPDYDPSDARAAVWDRARAIVDAAVLFVESQAEVDAAQNAEPFDGQRMSIAWNNSCDTWRKLRALERGEDAP